jgi:signal transduction histidine kinase
VSERRNGSEASADERLRLALELGQRITAITDQDRLQLMACRLIAEAFGYDTVALNLVDPLDPGRLYQSACWPPERLLPRTFRVPLGSGLTGWVAQHGAPRLVDDVTLEPQYLAGPGRRTRSELDVPMVAGGRTIGVLNVESDRRRAFAPEDVPYLAGLAGQLAQAIENGRLAARARELAAAEERARLARDLHDETMQSLVVIGRQLDLLALDLADPAAAQRRLDAVHDLVDRTLEGVRRVSKNLRPAVLEDLGLAAAVEARAEELGAIGLHVDVSMSGTSQRLSPAVEYAAYRVVQEALNNVARHAGTGEAQVDIQVTRDELTVVIADAGRGFRPRTVTDPTDEGQGLTGMRDRTAEIGGQLRVESAPGKGTRVQLWVPLRVTLFAPS